MEIHPCEHGKAHRSEAAGGTAASSEWVARTPPPAQPTTRPGQRKAGVVVSELRAVPGELTLYLDEIEVVPGWETLVRRLIDERDIDTFVSGSSAKLLSREVATPLRGRAVEVLVHPFSFREALRHGGAQLDAPWEALSLSAHAGIDGSPRTYLKDGGFPEAQDIDPPDRWQLLKGYVDSMMLRDVIDRHQVSNPQALRWLQRHLLATPGGHFGIKKLYDSLRSRGVPLAKHAARLPGSPGGCLSTEDRQHAKPLRER